MAKAYKNPSTSKLHAETRVNKVLGTPLISQAMKKKAPKMSMSGKANPMSKHKKAARAAGKVMGGLYSK